MASSLLPSFAQILQENGGIGVVCRGGGPDPMREAKNALQVGGVDTDVVLDLDIEYVDVRCVHNLVASGYTVLCSLPSHGTALHLDPELSTMLATSIVLTKRTPVEDFLACVETCLGRTATERDRVVCRQVCAYVATCGPGLETSMFVFDATTL